jgi:hypothetical protein
VTSASGRSGGASIAAIAIERRPIMLANFLCLAFPTLEPLSRLEALGEQRMIWMRVFAIFACLGLIAYGLGATTRADDAPQR